MFKSWGGTVGYCLLIQNNKSGEIINMRGFVKAKPKAIKRDKDFCDKFQKE